MARQIVLQFDGADVAFDVSSVDREKLYGKRRRVPLDRDKQPCTRAALTRDGSVLIRSGMTAQGFFDDQNVWVPNSELVGLGPDGKALPKVESTLGMPVALTPASPQDVLDHAISTVYALDGEAPEALKNQLLAGKLFCFSFNYRADWRPEVGFLVAAPGDGGLFALIGKPTPPTVWSGLDSPPPAAAEENPDDDLDFEMF